MSARPLAPPTEKVRRAQERLLARVSVLRDDATGSSAETSASAARPLTPRVPDDQRYVLREALATGGIGVIRRAEDRRLGRVIAVKELLRDSPDAQRRFALEAAITARLQHPGIVPLYDLGWHAGGEPFYCMKLVDGESLDAKIEQATTLPQRLRLVEHVIAVADAIAYAHEQRVLHRDLKPANVLVGRFGETVVIDWGLAKDLALANEMSEETGGAAPSGGVSDMTEAGTVLGTLRYMPPEQAAGEAVDVRSDVYALGAILYHVLSGKPPFASETGTRLAAQVLAGGFVDLRRLDPAIPAELATITHRAMARDPAARYPSAAAFAEDLRRFQAGRMVAAHTYSLTERARLWARTHRAAVAASALTLAAGAVLTWQSIEQARVTAAERARAEEAEREADAQAEKAARIAFERQAIADAQRLEASILRAQNMAEETDRVEEARTIARTAVTEALASGGSIAAATRALAATLLAPRVLAEVGQPGDGYVDEALWLAGGEVIATLVQGQRLRLWDVASGERLVELADVHGAEIDADGALLTAGKDGLVRRDAHTGEVTARLGDETGLLAMSPDRRLVAASTADAVYVRDAASGALVAKLSAKALVAAFSGDGARLVTGFDGQAKLWSLPRGELLGDLPTTRFMYTAVAISGDGTRVAVSSNDADIYLWDTSGARPKLIRRAVGPAHETERIMFSADGSALVSVGMDGTWFLWDPADGRLVRRIDGDAGHFNSADLSADGKWLAVGAGDGTARLWEVATGALRATLRAEHRNVMAVRFSADARRILTGTSAGPAMVWELQRSVPARWRVDVAPAAIDIDGAHDRLVLAGATGVSVLRGADGVELARLAADGLARSQVELSPDAARLFTAASDGSAELWDTDTGARRCGLPVRVDLQQPVNFLADAAAVVTVDVTRTVHVWSTDDCRCLHTLRGGFPYGRLRATPAGQLVFPAGTRTLEVVDPWSSGSGVLLEGMPSSVLQVAFSGDGAQVFAHGSGGHGRLWDARSGEVLADLAGNSAMILSAVFSPDDSTILTVDYGHSARLWRADDLSPIARLEGRRHWLAFAGVFSPDGQRVMIADQSGEVGLWDARDGSFAGVLARLHAGPPLALAFTADGADALVAGPALGAARLPATPEGILAAAGGAVAR